MRNTYSLTISAKKDLIEIKAFSKKKWSIEQSKRYLLKIKEAFNLLSNNQKIGVIRSELGNNIYNYPVGSHMIYYKLIEERIIILAVLHKKMIPNFHLADRV